jgi:hypothetical protein
MTGGQIAALIFAILLLLPCGCFVFFGFVFLHGLGESPHSDAFDPSLLLIGLGILAAAGLLFWVAFRRQRGRGDPV